MFTLIIYEIKKFFKTKIAYAFIIISLIVTFLMGLIGLSQSDYSDFSNKLNNAQNNLETVQSNISSLKEIEANNKNAPELELLDTFLKEELLLKNYIAAIKSNNNTDILKYKIQLDDLFIENISNNNIIFTFSNDEFLLTNYKEKFFLQNNIHYINNEALYPSGLNLLLQLTDTVNILFIIIIFIYLSSTIFSDEFESGTFKLTFTLPITKIKIIMSKLLSSIVISLFYIIIIFILPLLIGSILTEFGDPNYPVLIFNNANKNYNILDIVAIEKISKILLYSFVYIIFISIFINCICLLISLYCKNKTTSLILSYLVFVLGFISTKTLNSFSSINPFAYLDIIRIITGKILLTNPLNTLFNGYILLTLIIFISIFFISKKSSKLNLN